MAMNMLRVGISPLVWNRTPATAKRLAAAGAEVAQDAAVVFAQSDVVILMLPDGDAIDSVTGRGTPRFAARVAGRVMAPMGTITPAYSRGLEAAVQARRPLCRGCGVGVARARRGGRPGRDAGRGSGAVEALRPLLVPMCRQMTVCLAEAVLFARSAPAQHGQVRPGAAGGPDVKSDYAGQASQDGR
jgi:3-hydroxyisobutyrate dehydrogenase